MIPRVGDARKLPAASRIDIEFDRRLILVRDGSGKVAALFHCSIAQDASKRPSGPCSVVGVTHDPEYLFDPAYWPEVTNVTRRLRIPPGPRSPVGVCWIGLSIDGYGIHGTPRPEQIGKTGSHGCFRLTNWDVARLSQVVGAGTDVRFLSQPARFAAAR
jgi:lipoprotein-anchoring transpeptidase ErfK/SrfK